LSCFRVLLWNICNFISDTAVHFFLILRCCQYLSLRY
jgi:hypothetical protein